MSRSPNIRDGFCCSKDNLKKKKNLCKALTWTGTQGGNKCKSAPVGIYMKYAILILRNEHSTLSRVEETSFADFPL